MKRRFRDTLELKRRLAVGPPLTLAPGLVAAPEQWRRWSPADDRVALRSSDTWIDVHKVVYKRRFTGAGSEIPWVSHPPSDVGSGCDVEVSEVTLGARTDWSFSLAAFGPEPSRRATLRLGWDALVRLGPPPEGFADALRRPAGYPQWLLDELSASDHDLLV